MALSKRRKAIDAKLDGRRLLPLADALGLLKEMTSAKFDESMDVAINLGVDPRKSDQVVRGATVMPNGTGKPGSMLAVSALNALQNSMMLTPR